MKEIYGHLPSSYIYYGDCIKTMDIWLCEYKDKVNLVYIDPPLYPNHSSKIIQKIGLNQGKITLSNKLYNFSSELKYKNMMEEVISKSKSLLLETGSIFIYCTPTNLALYKNILDNVFGKSNFMNEIIYKHNRGGNSDHHFSRGHDIILFYRKSSNSYFDPKPTSKPRGKKRRNHMKKNTTEDGRVYYSIITSNKEYKYYEDDLVHIDDVWDDIAETFDNDRYRCENQKPLSLLERIIISACPESGLICSPFCGTGTTGVAAAKLGRNFLLSDNLHYAINITKSNLASFSMPFGVIWNDIDVYSEKPDIKFSYKDSKVHLDDYRVFGGESYYSNNLLPTEDTLVENWSVGRLINDIYYIDDYDIRTHAKPVLGRYLQLKTDIGKPHALTYDVFGNQVLHELAHK